ncbi:MAG: hypothetical protein ABFR82_02355 [Nitrospirota bacterium]
MIKKILLVASFKPEGSGSIYLKALRQQGHDPLCFDMRDENDKVYNRTKNQIINSIVSPYVNRILNYRLISFIDKFEPDMILLQKGLCLDTTIIDKLKTQTQGHLHFFDNDIKAVEEMLLVQ